MKKQNDRVPCRWPLLTAVVVLCSVVILGWKVYSHSRKLELPYLTAESVVVLDMETGRFVFAKNADIPRSPASLTKLMSLMLVLDDLETGSLGWDDTYIVTEQEAFTAGSKYGITPGENFTVRQLIAGAVMSSGCDCIQCLVKLCSGDETAFAVRMNREAAKLGLNGSHFANAAGIDAIDTYMTARDVASLSQELLEHHPEILEFTASSELTIGEHTFQNTNRLVGTNPSVQGLKTGTSQMGGYNLDIYAEIAGKRYIIVLLGSNDDNSRYSEAAAILDVLSEKERP